MKGKLASKLINMTEDIYDIARRRILHSLFSGDKFPKKLSELDRTQLDKIGNHADRYGHTTQEVLDAVLNNEVAYRAIVGKSPARMDYYEDTLIEFLNKLKIVKNADKLPKSGPNAKYIVEGKILTGGGRRNDVKSLDIEITFRNGKKLFVVHKYTMEDGGAQDNQYREAKETLKQIYTKDRKVLVNLGAVLDGDYYVKSRTRSLTRLEIAKNEHPETIVCTYETFEQETKAIWSQV
jgi:hypothetical protein